MSGGTLEIDPLSKAPDADLVLPGSKSITNRALIAAALATGPSMLRNGLVAEDTMAMVECLRSLGVALDVDAASSTMAVEGSGGALRASGPLWVRQSGTTARFVLPLAAIADGVATVDGDDQIRARPQADILDALGRLGAAHEPLGAAGRLPVRFAGAGIRASEVEVAGDVSSQFVSGLLLAAPVLAEGLTIMLTGDTA